MIQAVIIRMANNSHQLKQWCMVAMAAGWGLMVKHDDSFCVFIGMSMLTGVFWYLSSYYLQCERMFRNMYDEVVRANGTNQTASEHRKLFSLTPTSEDRKYMGCRLATYAALVLSHVNGDKASFFLVHMYAEERSYGHYSRIQKLRSINSRKKIITVNLMGTSKKSRVNVFRNFQRHLGVVE